MTAEVMLTFQNHLFMRFFCLTPNLLKTLHHYEDANFSLSTFIHGPILMKICINANIMKTQYISL